MAGGYSPPPAPAPSSSLRDSWAGAIGSPSLKQRAAGSTTRTGPWHSAPRPLCLKPASPGLGAGFGPDLVSGPAPASVSFLALHYSSARKAGRGPHLLHGHMEASGARGARTGAFAGLAAPSSFFPTVTCALPTGPPQHLPHERGHLSWGRAPLPPHNLLGGPLGLGASRPGNAADLDLAFRKGLSFGWAGSCPTSR